MPALLGTVWRELSGDHRRYLLAETVIGAATVNFALTGALAWLFTLGQDSVKLWGVPLVDRTTIVVDTVGTFFVLPFLTCLVITAIAHRYVRSGRLPPLGWSRAAHPLLGWLPGVTVRRALTLGALCMAALGPPAVVLLAALGGEMSIAQFVLYKAIVGLALGLIVTPPIAVLAISDAPAPVVAPGA